MSNKAPAQSEKQIHATMLRLLRAAKHPLKMIISVVGMTRGLGQAEAEQPTPDDS